MAIDGESKNRQGNTMNRRRAGILLHPTSLPGPEGIGTFGRESFLFIDRLRESGFTLWQILPLGPTGYGNSPYSCFSAFAGNPLLVDLRSIAEEGDLERDEIPEFPESERIDFQRVVLLRMELLRRAARRFLDREPDDRKREFWRFCDTTFWLHDYALFMALHRHVGGKPWYRWPVEIRERRRDKMEEWSERLGPEIGVEKYIQWQFRRQWERVRRHAARQGILIIGDTPIYVAADSCDVWCNRHLFMLDDQGKPSLVAGVPPTASVERVNSGGTPSTGGNGISTTGSAGGSHDCGAISPCTTSSGLIISGVLLPAGGFRRRTVPPGTAPG